MLGAAAAHSLTKKHLDLLQQKEAPNAIWSVQHSAVDLQQQYSVMWPAQHFTAWRHATTVFGMTRFNFNPCELRLDIGELAAFVTRLQRLYS